MIGIAFSLGFTVGPLMGAYFALRSRTTGNVFYQTPALLALAFSFADLLFIWVMMPETLTKDAKVGYENILETFTQPDTGTTLSIAVISFHSLANKSVRRR